MYEAELKPGILSGQVGKQGCCSVCRLEGNSFWLKIMTLSTRSELVSERKVFSKEESRR